MKPHLSKEAQELKNLFEQQGNPLLFQQEVMDVARERFNNLLDGVRVYKENVNVFPDRTKNMPVVWRDGSSRLLDYGVCEGAEDASVLLCVPSLINKSYIFDLTEEYSLTRYFSAKAIQTFLLDWGEPGKDEESFSVADYVTNRLEKAITHIHNETGRKVILLGYCMGGLMALAAAQLYSDKVQGLALLATPWDFHSADVAPINLNHESSQTMEQLFDSSPFIPPVTVQLLFYFLHPFTVHEKFRQFAGFKDGGKKQELFLLREQWLNDGVALTKNVAKDCFINWAVKNVIFKGLWEVGEQYIDPKTIDIPTFVAIPERDVIVPKGCAEPLCNLLPQAKTYSSSTGHISMVVGGNARDSLWIELENWVQAL